MTMKCLRVAAFLLLGIFAMATAGCLGSDPATQSTLPRSFATYRSEALERLEQRRAFQTEDRSAELAWNAPTEWLPQGQPRKGILLVHGLGDSPWTFHDIGEQLAARGFLVRAILLPGHGTRPEDLLDVKLRDWQRVVDQQMRALENEVGQVYIGAFSLGADLALDYAYAHSEVAGLLLFSPAFKSDEAFAWLTPWIGWAVPWVMKPKAHAQNAVRYSIVPTNAFAQYYHASRKAQNDLNRAPYGKPVLMVVAEHDDILDSAFLFETFRMRFTHPASRLIWYGNPPPKEKNDPRVLVRTDHLPDLRISQFSHMCVTFSPDNPLYGIHGTLRISSGDEKSVIAANQESAPVWYAGWGYKEKGKTYARLTFNPYFDWQANVMDEVLQAASGAALPEIK